MELINEVNKFNKTTPIFTNWITVRQAIEEMHNNSFPKWKEAEWAGFYLEYLYSSYIDKNHIQNIIEYLNNKSSLTRHLDFDLYFHNANFYGDLKSSSSSEKSTMLNDKSNILFELNSYGKLWYLIYEHDTVKDRDLDGHPFTKSRLEYIRLFEPNYKLGEDLSYYQRLKAKVKYCKMFIVEINKINYSSLLEEMTSNFHQPDGTTLRQPKLKFTKENIKNAIVYSYFPTN